ncbi:FAD/NAD(P)-binding protein [Ensifer aridi]|uniref:FAD/NAD(P)-binding protein n=1 Tax=Ensifer aridi TaxID=1708715 RepID=UPI00041C1F41|nr:FAD/NAD(P)-binding protein [Ensifer aridi]
MEEICLVGGGATSVAFMMSLAESGISANSLNCPRIVLISGNSRPGPGFAFNTTCHFHKVNTPSSLMSVVPSHSDDFLVWLKRTRRKSDRAGQPQQFDTNYLPRSVYGQYLVERLSRAIDLLRNKGISVDIVRGAATDIRLREGRVELRSGERAWIRPRWLVYAPGHPALPNFPELEASRFFVGNPYAHEALPQLHSTDRVAVLGTGLTAVDVIMQLVGNGFSGRIDCYSRNALLPTVQSCVPQSEVIPEYLSYEHLLARRSRKGDLRVADLLKFLSLDLRAFPGNESELIRDLDPSVQHTKFLEALLDRARVGDLPLQALLQATRSYAHKIWHVLPHTERSQFLLQLQRMWDVWRYPIPCGTAETILKELRNGRLTINRLIGRRCVETGIVLEAPSGGTRYQLVIDGTGGHGGVSHTRDPFLRQALQLGLFQASAYGGLAVDIDTLKAKTGHPIITNTFLLGQISKGELFSTNALWFNRKCAQNVAYEIIKQSTLMAA